MGTRYTDELAAWADQKAEKKRRQDAAGVLAMDGHGEPVASLFAAHRVDAVGHAEDAVEVAHRGQRPEQQSQRQRGVLGLRAQAAGETILPP